jgi:hypothetical protein
VDGCLTVGKARQPVMWPGNRFVFWMETRVDRQHLNWVRVLTTRSNVVVGPWFNLFGPTVRHAVSVRVLDSSLQVRRQDFRPRVSAIEAWRRC